MLRDLAVSGGEVGDRDVELLEVRGCAFTQVSFTGASFVRAGLQDVSFTDCELSGCTFEESRFHRVSFTGCRMRGVAFPQADMDHTSFASCLMAEAWIRMAKLTTTRFTACNLQHADLYGTTLRRSQLLRCECDMPQPELRHRAAVHDERGGVRLRPERALVDERFTQSLGHSEHLGERLPEAPPRSPT